MPRFLEMPDDAAELLLGIALGGGDDGLAGVEHRVAGDHHKLVVANHGDELRVM